MKKPSVGIIGAGTAGLATAIAFARCGHHVEVFEKHPSLATLGAGVLIQPQGVEALGELGVLEHFLEVSVPIDRLTGKCDRGWTLVDILYKDFPARAVSRSALGAVLFEEACRLGVDIRFGAKVELAAGAETGRLQRDDGTESEFDLVVIANGAASALPARAGLSIASELYRWGALWALIDVPDWPDQRLLAQRYAGTARMFGIMPTERVGNALRVSFFWSLRGDRYAQWRATPLANWKAELLALWPESEPVVRRIVSHDQFAFATYYHARPQTLARPPVCIVGDAAHAMSPQLGLGSTLAVQDTLALAACVSRWGVQEGAVRYSRKRLRTVRAYQAFSRLLTPCFQADGGGWWRDALFAGGLLVPGMRHLMYRSIASPSHPATPGLLAAAGKS